MRHLTHTCLLSGLVVGLWGCPVSAPMDAGGGSVADAGSDAGIDLSRADSCPVENPWVVVLEGQVVDEERNAVVKALVQTCVRTQTGRLLCLQPVPVDERGHFEVIVPEAARCMDRATARVLEPLADRATVYCHLDLPADAPTLTVTEPFVLPTTRRAEVLPPLGEVDAPRVVQFSGGVEVDVVPSAIFTDDYDSLAARTLAPTDVPACMLNDAPQFVGLLAFSPEGNINGSGFSARIPNTYGLASGALMNLYAQGGLLCALADGETIEEGEWARFGEGMVSSDGTIIEIASANGLPCFNWLGLAAAP